ncbi:MAG: helix-turn-helix domain-containing protein [Thermoanaerobaculia bacterium]|jgi:AraC-like DNA-binding protein
MERHLSKRVEWYLSECFRRGATPRVTEFTHISRISRFAASRAARRVFGRTLRDLFHHRQVVEAQRALERGLTTEAAARSAGFTSPSTFFRTFRKYTGTTPAAFAHKVAVDHQIGRR